MPGVSVFKLFTPAFLLYSTATLMIAEPVNYGRDVRPILSENCFHCHGQDSRKRMANLRLDTAEAASKRDAIRERINTSNASRHMPPAWSNRVLTKEQTAILNRWIEEGAEYSQHWAFVPPRTPSVPAGVAAHPIDALVRAKLAAEGLRPSPPAPKRVWLRRVSLDLTGLPPTPEQIDQFEQDRSPDSWAKQVDRLIASPAFGERMAIDWMDVARYADTHGFNNDAERSMWRWRDWVIEAFNRNMPYDRFLTEQLAGDLLPSPTLDQRIATGFGRNHVINSEGGIIEEEYRVEYVADRVRTLGMAWLGLTVECARCHDHKYDPVTQRDFYRFFAFFNNVPELGEDGRVANAVPLIPAPTADQQKQLAAMESQIGRLEARIASRAKTLKPRADVTAVNAGPPQPTLAVEVVEAERGRQTAPEFLTSRRAPMTISAWITPTADDADAPLLSAVDYKDNPAAVSYGKGIEVRLVKQEIEFRLADRMPAYSVRVQSEGAGISPGQRHHIAVVYTPGPADAMRVHAAWVKLFVDGEEVPTKVLNDGAMIQSVKDSKGWPARFRVGWDNQPKPGRYNGGMQQVSLYDRALAADEIDNAFRRVAVPEAAASLRAGKASSRDQAVLLRSDARLRDEVRELRSIRAKWLELRRSLPTVMVMEEMATPRPTHVLLRGTYNMPGEKVEPGVPEALLGAWPEGAPRNRLGLARWLTNPNHPLTSRVVVNRFWQQLFGAGLVKSSDNFGLQGDSPSHPELLDWMATEFVKSGWDVKALLRQIVLSDTYRQASSASQEQIARDPENRLLARGPRLRLPAELIRDQALFVSGLLKPRVGGPSVFPYQKEGLLTGIVVAADYPGTKWIESQGDDLFRRSLYTFWKRTVTHPAFTVFDAPDREVCVVRRSVTNTPLQALTLMNDPIYLEAARKLAERAVRSGGTSAASQLSYAFRLAAGRNPEERELDVLRRKLDEMLTSYTADPAAAEAFVSVGKSPRDTTIPVTQLAAWTAIANLILNLDEVITKG